MAISMERFSSQGHFATYQPAAPVAPQRIAVFELQCRSCGYEPEGVTPPRLCPKCHGNSWERFARPGSILANAQRY
jgi:rubrerythrin